MDTVNEFGESLQKKYVYGTKIGEGSYGLVHQAKCVKRGDMVAIKKVRWQTETVGNAPIEGVSATAIREVSILKKYKHENIIRLRETFSNGTYMFLVFDCLEYDMKSYMTSRHYLENNTPKFNKNFLHSLLMGVRFLHLNRIIHRDLKPMNILLDAHGRVKIADLGLARTITHTSVNLTPEVVTLWYRAPEIILRSRVYGKPMDLWSVGCLYYEFVHGRPLFDGEVEMDQLFKIFEVLGSPDKDTIRRIAPDNFLGTVNPSFVRRDLRKLCSKFDQSELDLVKSLLEFDPNQRITAKQALNHPAFELVNLRKRRTSFNEIEDKNLPYPKTSFFNKRTKRDHTPSPKDEENNSKRKVKKATEPPEEVSKLKRNTQSRPTTDHNNGKDRNSKGKAKDTTQEKLAKRSRTKK